MKTFMVVSVLVLAGAAASAQKPLKVIDGGALDKIELFVSSLDRDSYSAVVMKPFDGSEANRGTGEQGGKEARSSVKVAGTVTDASGRTLATFEQRRIG